MAGTPGLIRVGSSSERGARSPCASKNSQGDPPERGAQFPASALRGWGGNWKPAASKAGLPQMEARPPSPWLWASLGG